MSHLPPYARYAIYVHALLGLAAILSGAVAILAKKGGGAHRAAGKTFVVAMLSALVFAQPAILARDNVFLGLLTPFTVYLVLRGYRLAKRRREGIGAAAGLADRLLAGAAVVVGGALIARGAVGLARGGSIGGFAIVSIGLGALSLRLGLRDFAAMRPGAPEPPKNAWMREHLVMMLGAYTAAMTAFTAVNFPKGILPTAIVWLAPSAVGTVAIVMWLRRLRRKSEPVSGES